MRLYYIIIVLLFICRTDVQAANAQGPIVITSDLRLNSKSITFLSTDPTMSVVANTSIPSTQAITLWSTSMFYGIGNSSNYSSINGSGFVKASGTTLSYDNSTYYLASNPGGYTNNTGTVTSVASGAGLTGTVTTSGTISMPNVGTAGTYGSSTEVPVLTTDAQGRVSGVTNTTIIPYVPSINAVTRPINSTTFTPSATKQATLIYYIQISCTASIGSNAAGTILLQYSINAGSSYIDAGTVKNSNTVTLAIALNSVTLQTAALTAIIPAGALCRMVPTTTGTTTLTYISGQEIY